MKLTGIIKVEGGVTMLRVELRSLGRSYEVEGGVVCQMHK